MSQNRNDTTSGQRGPKLTVRKIPKEQAIGFIRRYHYSKIMPRLNKHYLGFYTGNRLAGVVALAGEPSRSKAYGRCSPATGSNPATIWKSGRCVFSLK